MRIVIETVPKSSLRYDTWGDYFFADGTWNIQISDEIPTENERFLIALHELVEMWLCQHRGITQTMIDDFDMSHEEYCAECDVEPGDMEGSPYQREHRFSMLIEHLVARELGMNDYGVVR